MYNVRFGKFPRLRASLAKRVRTWNCESERRVWLEGGEGGGGCRRLCTMYDLESSRACARISRRTLVIMIFDAYKR